MKTEETLIKSYQKKVVFEVAAEEMKKYYDKAFAKIKKTASINGFRKGKAPASLLLRSYGRSIEMEAIDMAINESYRNYLMEKRITPLSQAQIENVDAYKADENFKFTAILEIHPDIKLKEEIYSDLEVEQLKVKVTDEEIAATEKKLLDDYSTVKPSEEAIKTGSIVKIELKPVKSDNWEEKTITVGEKAEEEKMDKQLIGLKKGEEKTISFEDAEGKTVELNVKIKEVSEKETPELNDEFVKNLDAKFTSVEIFKAEMKKNILEQKEKNSENGMFNSLVTKIVANYEGLEVPPTILDSYLNDVVASTKKQFGDAAGIDDEMLKNIYRESATQSLKWEYLKQAIIRDNKLEVKEEAIENKLKEIAEKNNMDVKEIKAFYKSREHKNMLIAEIMEENIREFLKSKNTIKFVDELTVDKEAREAKEAAEKNSEIEKAEIVEEKKAPAKKAPAKKAPAKKAATKKKKTTKETKETKE